MPNATKTVMVGTSTNRVTVELTPAAVQVMGDLPATAIGEAVMDQDALLSTIVISRAASGRLAGDVLLLDAIDIIQAVDQPAAGMLVDPPTRR